MSELPQLVIDREFKAPKSLVWKCWTNPELLAKWYGPNVETIIHKFELSKGGEWLNEMRMEKGSMFSKAVFQDVNPEDLLSMLMSSTDENWNIIASPMMPNWPATLLTIAEFTEKGDVTNLRFVWEPHDASAAEIETFASMKDRMGGGWGMGFNLMDELLAELQA